MNGGLKDFYCVLKSLQKGEEVEINFGNCCFSLLFDDLKLLLRLSLELALQYKLEAEFC